MGRWLRIVVITFAVLAVLGGCVAGWFLLINGRAPARRPDLLRLPEGMAKPPRGYPTPNALYLSYFLGRLKLVDYKNGVPLPAGVVEKKDIEYGRVDDRSLKLDLYRPVAPHDPVPGLIFIHGGAWKKGDRSDYKYYTVRFAERGYVVATVSYRFSREAPFPAAVEDVKCAVRWMRANAAALGVDPGRIAAIGGSAGGHLAMMAAYSPDLPELEGRGGHQGISSAVQAVVNLYGPSDLTTPEARVTPSVVAFMGVAHSAAADRYKLASPLYHLDVKDPPTLIIHGTIDQLVPVEQSDRLAEKLQRLGVPYWYDRLDGWPHTLDAAQATNERTQFLVNAFLDRFLKDHPRNG